MPTDYAIKDGRTVFDATTYAGTGAQPQTITNAGSFKPDLIWIKNRSTAGYGHSIQDSVRGLTTGKKLRSDTTSAEGDATYSPDTSGYVSAANANGFALSYATGGDARQTHNSNDTYVAWQWQAGQGTTSSNTNGSITSTVSVNPTAGFSIVTYTGNGSAGATVGHGLGVAPKMIIVKRRNSTGDWPVYHTALGNTNLVWLDLTNASTSTANAWNNTSPTSSVFSLGVGTDLNASGGTYVAYCWAEVPGFSKFGSYTGNGSTDGPFIYLGFRPKYILVKRTDSTGEWDIVDTSRDNSNVMSNTLLLHSSSAEAVYSWVDSVSNGFKIRNTSTNMNASGGTYIYVCFAENPFKYANAR